MAKIDKAYLVGIHRYSFRSGEPAEIQGVVMNCSMDYEFKPCYKIKFADGTEDLVPIYDEKNYKIIGFKDILEGNLPEVTE